MRILLGGCLNYAFSLYLVLKTHLVALTYDRFKVTLIYRYSTKQVSAVRPTWVGVPPLTPFVLFNV